MSRRKYANAQGEHSSFLSYAGHRWLKIGLLAAALAIAGYAATDFEPVRNGGTWYGYTLGTVGALLIVWLSLLGMRKRAITQGHWSLKAWTSAHVYLGLTLTIIATLHTGFQFGWNVHTLSYALMMIVILSGVFGIYTYATIPRQMSDNRGEMGQQDMLDELTSLNQLLDEGARPLNDTYIPIVRKAMARNAIGGSVFRRLSGRARKCATQTAITSFRAELPNISPEQRTPVLDILAVLERKNSLLIRIRKHIRFKAVLQVWLFIHIPLTFALIAALVAHIVAVFYYN